MQYIFPKLRNYQANTLEKIKLSRKKFIIICAPTGSGKSFFPAQLTYEGEQVLSLVGTKSLQTQYTNYNMGILFGKGNYDCLKQSTMFGDCPSADDCELKKNEKRWCNENCPYPLAKREFLNKNGGVLNYSKFLLDQKLVEDFNPEYLFCDEAHLLSDIVLNYAGLQFYWKSRELQKYSPGKFPVGLPQPIAFQQAIEWLETLQGNLNRQKPLLPHRGGKIREYRWHKTKLREVFTTLNFMKQVPEAWHIESDHKGLLIKPKTARFNFINLFDCAEKVILMSATLDKHTLRELGIREYEWIEIPNSWPAPLRPVTDLNAPKIGFRSSEVQWCQHAEIIAHALNQRLSEHTGLIHVTSKKMAKDLASRLCRLTQRKIFVPDEWLGTEEVYSQWSQIENDGTIGIFWQAWEGWDCGKDSINIVAKTPFVPIRFDKGLPVGFDTHRYVYDTNASQSRVAAKFMQGLGRIRRGNQEDYGNNKFVGIADGNWTRVKKYFHKSILESVR